MYRAHLKDCCIVRMDLEIWNSYTTVADSTPLNGSFEVKKYVELCGNNARDLCHYNGRILLPIMNINNH